MAYISASTLNTQSKCELSYHLSRTEEGKKLRDENGLKWALANGTIIHHACQSYDIDRFVNKIPVQKTDEEVRNRYEAAYNWFFTDPENLKKEKITPEQAKLGLQTMLACRDWLWEENVKKAAELNHVLGTLQDKLKWTFTARKPLSWYYKESYGVLQNYIFNNPLDAYGEPVEFEIEKAYNIQYGEDVITGYADERLVFNIEGRKCIFIKEMKTSATEYTPLDCQIDNQMGLYAFYEHVDSQGVIPLSDIYLVMHQLPFGVCTITQRTEENIDFLMRHVDERLRRTNEIKDGKAMPLPRCGTNSFDHMQIMCDYKDICPVMKQALSQVPPLILGTKPVKEPKGKKK